MRKMFAALQAKSLQPLSSRYTNLIWIALLCSTVIFIQARFGPSKFGINLSPFDVLVPVVAGWCLLRRQIDLPPQSIWLISAGLLMLLAAHAALSFGVREHLSIPHLAQGSVKFAAFVILSTLLIVLFRDKRFRHPPFTATAIAFVAASSYLIILYAQPNVDSLFVPFTGLISGLLGMLFLLAISAYNDGGNTKRFLVGIASIVAAAISILLFNKGFALVAFSFLVVISFAWRGMRFERFTEGRRLVVSLIAVLIVASAAIAAMQLFEVLPTRTDSIARSLAVRGALWSQAISVSSANFPLGIGAGQFSTTSGSLPELAVEGHEVAHNTALTWITEFGLLGFLFAVGAAALAWHAALSWPGGLRLMFLLYLAVPLILHDGHGIRMVMLILALGTANLIYRGEAEIGQSSRTDSG
jgi:hypothetical protein